MTYQYSDLDAMIVFDNETTGLTKPNTTPLENQPHIIEFAAIKLNAKTLEEIGRMEFLCKPPVPITAEITNITGITQDLVKDAKPFVANLKDLQEFFFGVRYLVAHNVAFDRDILSYELRRLQKIREFPWPIEHVCTVERTYDMHGHRMKLSALHKELVGEDFEGAHRAMADVEALVRVVKKLREQGRI